jgi:hypothetical protein
MIQENSNYVKKEPLRLTLQDFHLILKMIDEIEPGELKPEEISLKAKVLRISANIQKALAYSIDGNKENALHPDKV